MTDSMNLFVRIKGEEFVLPCAEGDQNIKWLAIAAVRLYSHLHKHSYCVRQRERFVSEGGVFLPHNVKRIGSAYSLDPRDTINTTLEDGETVEVEVQKSVKVGRNGILEPSEFHAKAFLTNEIINKRLVERLTTERLQRETKMNRENKLKEEADARIFGSIDEDTKEAFQIEFQKMVDKGVVGEDDADDLKETLARYFEEVDAIFKHFSGFYVGEPSIMSYSSFIHMVHKTKMLDITREVHLVRKIALESRIEMNKTVYPDGALTRGECSELIIRLAMMKYDDQPAPDALDTLMQEFVLPFLDICRLTDIQQTLESQDTLDVSRANFPRLQRIFCRYINSQSKPLQKFGPGTITQVEFKQLLRDAGVIPSRKRRNQPQGSGRSAGRPIGAKSGDSQINEISGVKVEEESFASIAFQKSQKDDTTQSSLVELGELSCPEFVEALMRFAMLYQAARHDHMDPKHMSLAKRTDAFEFLLGEIVTPANSQSQNASQMSSGQASGNHQKRK
jgi:hypothetical protein